MENLEEIEELFQNGNVLFKNQNYDDAIKIYREIKIKHEKELTDYSKMSVELALTKSLMKKYAENYSKLEEKDRNFILNEINKSLEIIRENDSENIESKYLEVEFNILIKNFDKSIEILNSYQNKDQLTNDMLLLYIIIYYETNNLTKCQSYFELLDEKIIPEINIEKIRAILEEKSELTQGVINLKINEKQHELGIGVDEKVAILLVAADNGINISNEINSSEDKEFLKNNRELLIEQKSLLLVKQGNAGEILDDYWAVDMLQNDKFLEYNWAFTKALIEGYSVGQGASIAFSHEAVGMVKWLLSKNFFNSKYHELLIKTISNMERLQKVKEHKILLSTAKKWKNTFSDKTPSLDSGENKMHEHTDDKKLMEWINENNLSLKQIIYNFTSLEVGYFWKGGVGVACKYGKKQNQFTDLITDEIDKMDQQALEGASKAAEMDAAMNEAQYDQNIKNDIDEYERKLIAEKDMKEFGSIDIDYSEEE